MLRWLRDNDCPWDWMTVRAEGIPHLMFRSETEREQRGVPVNLTPYIKPTYCTVLYCTHHTAT